MVPFMGYAFSVIGAGGVKKECTVIIIKGINL